MSSLAYEVSCFFISVHVDFLEESAELIDLAGKGCLLELSVSYGDVALLGIEEAPGIMLIQNTPV